MIGDGLTAGVSEEAIRFLECAPGQWVFYNNDTERRKWACNKVAAIGPKTAFLFDRLMSPEFVEDLRRLTGVSDLEADRSLHGGGNHAVEPGGWLSPHVDYAQHPHRQAMERRVNLILFLTNSHAEGGGFELYDDTATHVEARVAAEAGRCVVWCPGDVEYHGTQPVSTAARRPRLSAAVYYLAPIRPGVVRKRALFVPNRGA